MKKSNIILTCGLAFFGTAFAVGAVVAINSENNQTYEVAHAANTWSRPDLQGTGTSQSPYLIFNQNDLEKFRDIVNGSNGEHP